MFWLNTLKGTAKAATVDLLRLDTLRGTKTPFLIPKRYDKHPDIFTSESPPTPPWVKEAPLMVNTFIFQVRKLTPPT